MWRRAAPPCLPARLFKDGSASSPRGLSWSSSPQRERLVPSLFCTVLTATLPAGGTITPCLPAVRSGTPRQGEARGSGGNAGLRRENRARPPCTPSPAGAGPAGKRRAGVRRGKKRGVAAEHGEESPRPPPLFPIRRGRGGKIAEKNAASPCPEQRGSTEKRGGSGCRRRGRGRGAGGRLCACFPLPIAGEGHTRKA